MKTKVQPTDHELVMREDDFIVSKTDLKGIITYCNKTFMEFAMYEESELLGQPHNIIRHPDMPRVIFKLLWDTIQNKKEINAYVKNLSKDGSFYWVFANVTPVLNNTGEVVGYYSVRRKPEPSALEKIKRLYSDLLAEENKYSNRKEGMLASEKKLKNLLKEQGKGYEEFIFSL